MTYNTLSKFGLGLASAMLPIKLTTANVRWWFWGDGCLAMIQNAQQDEQLNQIRATQEAFGTEQAGIDQGQDNQINTNATAVAQSRATERALATEQADLATRQAELENIVGSPTAPSTPIPSRTPIQVTATAVGTPSATSAATIVPRPSSTPSATSEAMPQYGLPVVSPVRRVYGQGVDGLQTLTENVFFLAEGNTNVESTDYGSFKVPRTIGNWTNLFKGGVVYAQRAASDNPENNLPDISLTLLENGHDLDAIIRTVGEVKYLGRDNGVDTYGQEFDIDVNGKVDPDAPIDFRIRADTDLESDNRSQTAGIRIYSGNSPFGDSSSLFDRQRMIERKRIVGIINETYGRRESA